jgi:hypothetical protein
VLPDSPAGMKSRRPNSLTSATARTPSATYSRTGAPFHAWTNFEFRDSQGKWHEIDALVLGERRLHLIELKHYRRRCPWPEPLARGLPDANCWPRDPDCDCVTLTERRSICEQASNRRHRGSEIYDPPEQTATIVGLAD